MFTYDPGFTSTAACDSTITFIDGDKGELLHRGYPIDQLAEKSGLSRAAVIEAMTRNNTREPGVMVRVVKNLQHMLKFIPSIYDSMASRRVKSARLSIGDMHVEGVMKVDRKSELELP